MTARHDLGTALDRVADSLEAKAAELRVTAQAIRNDDKFLLYLGNEHAGPGRAAQIMQAVEDATMPRPGALSDVHRALAAAIVDGSTHR